MSKIRKNLHSAPKKLNNNKKEVFKSNFLSILLPFCKNFLQNPKNLHFPELRIRAISRQNNIFILQEGKFEFSSEWISSSKTKEKCPIFKEKKLESNRKTSKFFINSLDCYVYLKKWHLDFHLKKDTHQMAFFIVADELSFSFQKNQKNVTYDYSKKNFQIDLLSSKSLLSENKDFAEIVFRLKKGLLKVIFLFFY